MARRKSRSGFGGGRGLSPNNLMKQVQKMQEDMARLQAEAEQETYTVSAGGGMVEVVITGGMDVRSITLNPEVVDPEDVEMLQDLIVAAVNEAIQMARAKVDAKMSTVTGGLNIPGL